MKTVLLVSNVSAGLVNFRHELIEELLKSYRVVVLAADTGRVDECRAMGCEFIDMPMNFHGKNPFAELKLISVYKKVIRKVSPDIVLTYTIKPNIYAGMACASLGVPYVANITGLGTAVEYGGLMQKITVPLYRFGLRRAQKVFFQNQDNLEFMQKHRVISGAYDLIPGSGVNLSRYPLLEYPQGNTVDFVFIARIMKEKGIDQYLEAAKVIKERHPETVFHICGSCDKAYRQTLDELNREGKIVYHGRISDVVGMHKASACTIHPTYYPEGMSNVLLESCACGRPVIATNRPGCREIVEDGVTGFLVEEKNAQDLIEKIEQFLRLSPEARRQMGLAGRAKVEREFDRQIVIDKYMEEIRRACKDSE